MTTTEPQTQHLLDLSTDAEMKVAQLLEDEGEENLWLRIAVRAGGCSGFSYEMFFDTESNPDDHIGVFGPVTVRVDAASRASSRRRHVELQQRSARRGLQHRQPERPA